MVYDNEMTLMIACNSKNESFARISVAAFASQLDPTVSEIDDIKTAVSEAVTNSIIHGYENDPQKGQVMIKCGYKDDVIYIEIVDQGNGIDNIEQAMTPLYTSKPEMERSGMGFTVMETFMDKIEVLSEKGRGTSVKMNKKITRSQ